MFEGNFYEYLNIEFIDWSSPHVVFGFSGFSKMFKLCFMIMFFITMTAWIEGANNFLNAFERYLCLMMRLITSLAWTEGGKSFLNAFDFIPFILKLSILVQIAILGESSNLFQSYWWQISYKLVNFLIGGCLVSKMVESVDTFPFFTGDGSVLIIVTSIELLFNLIS